MPETVSDELNPFMHLLRESKPGDLVMKRRMILGDTFMDFVLRPIPGSAVIFDANLRPAVASLADLSGYQALIEVPNDATRLALTAEYLRNGSRVSVLDTGKYWDVVDVSALPGEDAFIQMVTGDDLAAEVAAGKVAALEAASGSALIGVSVFDDFQRADGVLGGSVTRSGHTWATTGPGASSATISAGKYVAGGAGGLDNTYAYLDYGSAIPRISGRFSFVKGSGANLRNSTSLTLIADKAGIAGGLVDMLHFRLSPDFWSIEKRVEGEEPFPVLATGSLHLQEGVVYSAAIEINGSTIRVFPPQGNPVTVTDSEIGDIAPLRYGNWQIRNLADSWQGRWHAVEMGVSNAEKRSDIVPAADVGFLRGAGVNARQKTTLVLSEGVGWYRVATESALMGAATIIGEAWITSNNANGADSMVLRAACTNSALLNFAQHLYISRGTPAITQARVSRLGSGNVALDLYLNVATITTIDINFFGYATLAVNNPAVGAVALASDSTNPPLALQGLASVAGNQTLYGTHTVDGTRGGSVAATGQIVRGGNLGAGSYIQEWKNFSGTTVGGVRGDGSVVANVVNTPAGNISATTVQAAINELDAEKVAATALVTARALDDYMELSTAPTPEVDTPVITQATGEATALSSPVVYKPYICGTGVQITGSDGQGDTYIRFGPGSFATGAGANSDVAMYGEIKPGGGAQFARWPVIASFTTSSSNSIVEVGCYSLNNDDRLFPLIEVNGRLLSDVAIRRSVTGNGWKFTLTFPTSAARTLKLYCGGAVGITAIRVPTGQTISKPAAPAKLIAFITDSFGDGAGSGIDGGASNVETYTHRIARLMSCDGMLFGGIGGTGFSAGAGTNNYITRASFVIGKSPDILVVNGSINDGAGAGTLSTDVAAFLAAVSSVPRVIVIGTVRAGYEANHDAVKAATLLAGREFVDMRSFINAGNTRHYLFADNVHPSTAGHRAIARAAYRQIA